MPYALVQITFEDYEKWREVFEEAVSLRESYGSIGVQIFRRVDRPNEVVILGEYEDLERAGQLFQSQEFREATRRAGVVGRPEVSFLDEAGRLPA